LLLVFSPATVSLGSSDFTLTVTGSGFVSGSTIRANGAPLPTTFMSEIQLTATVAASLTGSGGNLVIDVVNPDGQRSSGGSAGIELAVTNGPPTIASLAPNTVIAGAGGIAVVVTGTNFLSTSTISYGGSVRPAKIKSATQLAISLNAGDTATLGTVPITVTNPPPGGGTSGAAPFEIIPASVTAPTLTAISPATVLVGSRSTTVTLTGTKFEPSSQVLVNGGLQPKQFLSSNTLTTTIPDYFTASTIDMQILVENVDGGVSNPLLLPVVNPLPALMSISPAKVTAGGPNFLLQITGNNFQQGTQVLVNGSPREPFTISEPSSLLVPITTTDIATVGSLDISVMSPSPGGGSSSITKLQILPASNRLRAVNVQANDLAWNPKQNRIYAAVGSRSSTYAHSIVAIDPQSGQIVASRDVGSDPARLSLTTDQQYLYVSLPSTGSVARLVLPGLTPDIEWTLGKDSGGLAYHALDLQAAPGEPHTVAVTRAVYTSGDSGGIVIYDDGQARPKIALDNSDSGSIYDRIQWGADSTILYASIGSTTGAHEHTFTVSSTGLELAKDAANVFRTLSRFSFDPLTARFYDGGSAIDPSTGKLLGIFSPAHQFRDETVAFAADARNHRLYTEVASYPPSPNEEGGEIEVFDLEHYTYINSLFVPSPNSFGAGLIRWGDAGLALAGDQIYLLDGPFVTPGAVASSDIGGYATPAPALVSITPQTVPAAAARPL
jgi:hypothetical protein